MDGSGIARPTGLTARARLRGGKRRHSGAQPRRHGRAADTCRLRHRRAPPPPCQAARVCVHAPRKFGIAAAARSRTSPTCSHSARAVCRLPRFGATMALPWLAAIGVEWLVMRRFFASEPGRPRCRQRRHSLRRCRSSQRPSIGLDPRRILHRLCRRCQSGIRGARRCARPRRPRRAYAAGQRSATSPLSLDVPFLAFVLALGLIVEAISLHGLGAVVTHLVPGGTGLGSLLAIAAVAASPRERHQQPARGAAAASCSRRRGRGSGARRPHRRQHRTEPDLRRIAGDTALAPSAHPSRRGIADQRIPAARRAHRATGADRGDGRAVDFAARGGLMAAHADRHLGGRGNLAGVCRCCSSRSFPLDSEFTLLHVTPSDVTEAADAATIGLFGRGGHRASAPQSRTATSQDDEASNLLVGGRGIVSATRTPSGSACSGRVEREVVHAVAQAASMSSWSRGTATTRGSAREASGTPRASSSTTHHARSSSCGRMRRRVSNPFPTRGTGHRRRRPPPP